MDRLDGFESVAGGGELARQALEIGLHELKVLLVVINQQDLRVGKIGERGFVDGGKLRTRHDWESSKSIRSATSSKSQRAHGQVDRMQRLAIGSIMDLMAATGSGRADHRAGIVANRGKKPLFADAHR